MAADAPLPAHGRWCDLEGTRITLFCRVQQVAENPEDESLFSRLHQRGEVVGRGLDLIYIRFDGEGQVIGVRPHLLRVLTAENVSKGLDRP
ncbi:MAG TPA: hypothetical protein VFW64_04930 [Pseudonocardiaceae bacterium]|nr:hypothetical protein [Pseudonocardiaceae bacterium]